MQVRYFYSRWVVYYGVRTIRYWTIRSWTSRYEDNSALDNSALGQFGTRTIWSRTYACKTLKSGFFWYAVDTNLFRLGSTNPKKKSQTPAPSPPQHFFFLQKCSNIFKQIFFLSFQIYMKDAECAELKEKSNFRFFRFLFFEGPNYPSTELSGTELS